MLTSQTMLSILLLSSSVFVMTFITATYAKKGDQHRYRTTYACEGNVLNIVCDMGVIHLIRANFGRFSISICNDHGNLEWRVNCMSRQSFSTMHEMCNLKPSCSVNASTPTFHDPCPGTQKYLEVQYHCGSEIPTASSSTSSQPDVQKSAAGQNGSNVHYEERSPMFTPPSSAGDGTSIPVMVSTTVSVMTSAVVPFPAPPSMNISSTSLPHSSTTTAKSYAITEDYTTLDSDVPTTSLTITRYSRDFYCPPIVSRGINWTWTKAGETAVVKCPDGAIGYADWHCSSNTVQWRPQTPNMKDCRSVWLENIKKRMDQGASIISVTTELALTSYAKLLFSKDLKHIAELIQEALHKGVKSMENILDMWHRYNVLRELLQSIVKTLNNLLDDKHKTAWNDLSSSEQKAVASSLLGAIEKSALLLAETSSADGSFSLIKANILLSLQVINVKDSGMQFPSSDDLYTGTDGVYWTAMQDKILLPVEAVQEHSRHGLVRVAFIAYRNVNELLKPGPSIIDYPQIEPSENITRIVNSRVISASIQRMGNPKLTKPVTITLKHLLVGNATNPVCVHWNFNFRDWSAQGCWVEISNRTHTVCACDHLTNFAVIMEVKNTAISSVKLEIIRAAMQTGCIISAICLFVTVVVLFTLRAIGDEITIQKNMFICLLMAETIFVAGIDQTDHPLICALIAGALQYFFLATFSWMFFECYQQYVSLTISSDSEESMAKFYYIAAYILPAIIVGVSAVIDPSSYGNKEYCWLHVDNYFVFSFVGPAVGITFGSIIFFSITVCIFCQRASNTSVSKAMDDSKSPSNMKSFSGRSLLLMIFVVLTWTSGLLYIYQRSAFLAYSFSVLNPLLGAIILVFYCLRNEKVKQEYKEILRDKHLFLSCLWSDEKEESQRYGRSSQIKMSSKAHDSRHLRRTAERPDCRKTIVHGSRTVVENAEDDLNSIIVSSSDSRLASEKWNALRPLQSVNYLLEHEENSNSAFSQYDTSYRPHYESDTEVADSGNQFVDHIYETINEEQRGNANGNKTDYLISENFYGDCSDSNQRSFSIYQGCDQEPLLVQGIPWTNSNSPQMHNCTEARHSPREDGKMFFVEVKTLLGSKNPRDTILGHSTTPLERKTNLCSDSCNPIPAGRSISNLYQTETIGTSMPDLLQCNSDNPTILAVLKGEKVVSHLQQNAAQESNLSNQFIVDSEAL